MFIWSRLLSLLGLKRGSGPRYYELEETLHTALENLADHEQRSEDEVHADLLEAGLAQQAAFNEYWQCWESLSPRERDITALTCLGYTNRQIAARLHITPDTVKGYVRQVLVKFRLHGKGELHMLLSGWDFSNWGSKAQ